MYTSNEAPPDKPMFFHHEMAYQRDIPNYVFFYCDVPPAEGGGTPILLSYKARLWQGQDLMAPLAVCFMSFHWLVPGGQF